MNYAATLANEATRIKQVNNRLADYVTWTRFPTERVMDVLNQLLGTNLEPRDLNVLQVSLRAFLMFICGLIMMRLAHRRFLSDLTPLDMIIGFVLASMLSRAINGSSPLLPTIVAGFGLVLLHRGLSNLAWYSDRFGMLVKGEAEVLVKDGVADRRAMKHHSISEKDLLEESRVRGQITRIEEIGLATIERGGQISIIPRK